MLRKPWNDSFARGECFQFEVGFTKCPTVLIIPRDKERLRVLIQAERVPAFPGSRAKAIRLVNLFDSRNGRELEARLARVGIKFDGAGPDHGVGGNLLGRLQVTLEVRILHELHVTEIGEAFTSHGLAGGIDAKIDVEPGEVVHRVSVLTAGEPADRDAPGIACVLLDVQIQFVLDPCRGVVADDFGRLRQAFRRHALLFEYGNHPLPLLVAFADRWLGGQLLQVHSTHRLSIAVALVAVLFEGSRRICRRCIGAADRNDHSGANRVCDDLVPKTSRLHSYLFYAFWRPESISSKRIRCYEIPPTPPLRLYLKKGSWQRSY